MLTRYSEYFWHEDVELPRDGYKYFACDSLRDVWYDDAIYKRETPTHTDWYIHVVNTPEKEQCDEKVETDPPAVRRIPRGRLPARAHRRMQLPDG